MAQFQYKAQTIEGKKISGMLNAADELDLQQRLHEQNAFLLSYKERSADKSRKPLHPKILAEFSRQVSTLTAAGVTLVRALRIIAEEESIKPKEKAVYEDLLRQIRQGVSLSDAMEAENGAFPPLMINMYRSAEVSGNLDQVAMQMALYYEKSHKLNAKISGAMVYPRILTVMLVAVLFIISKFVLPQFQELFDQMEELPGSTKVLMGVSTLVSEHWVLVLVGLVVLIVGIRALFMIPKFRYQYHKLKLKVPLFGKLNRIICTSRFARTLSSLYSAGIPIVQGLQIARKTIGNDYLDAQFDQFVPYVRAGNNLSDGLDTVDGFSKKLSDSIRVGEETGSLDSMLISTADSMEYDADMAISKMVSYVEPIMLIVMGLVLGFVMFSIFSAIYGSYDAIAGMGS